MKLEGTSARPFLLAVLALGLCGPAARGAEMTAIWTGAAGDGRYSNEVNWDIGVVPNNNIGTDTYNVVIDTTGEVLMDVDVACTVTDLTLGSGQTLRVGSGHMFTVLDDAEINGVIDAEASSFIAQGAGASFGANQNARLIVDGGGVIDIAATAYSSAALGSPQTLFDVAGAGSLLDLSSLQSIHAGFDDGWGGVQRHLIDVSASATLDLSALQTLIGPIRGEDRLDLVITSDGFIALPALQEIYSAAAGNVRFDLHIPSYTLMNLLSAADAEFILPEGGTLSLPALTSFTNGSFDVPGDASVTAPNLLAIDGSRISVLPDGSFSAPLADTFTNSMLTVEAGQTLTLPHFVNIDDSRFDVRGGMLFQVAAFEYDSGGLNGPATLINAQGAGTIVDWSTVQMIADGWDDGWGGFQRHLIDVGAGATLDLSAVHTIVGPIRAEDRLDFVVTDATLSLPALQETRSTNLGNVRFELNVPSFSLLSLFTAADTDFDLMPGCALSLPALTTFTDGSFLVPGDASVTMPDLVAIHGTTVTVLPDGSFSAPFADTFTRSMLTIEAGQTLDLPTLVNIDDSRFDVRGGVTFTVAAADYASTALPGNYTLIDAQGAGTLVDWSTVQLINAAWDDGWSGAQRQLITASSGATIDLSDVTSIVAPIRVEDRVDITVNTGGTLDMTALTGSTGAGSLRYLVADPDSLLAIPSIETFDRPSQFTITSASTVRLGGIGVVGQGTFDAIGDVSGYPTAMVDGSIRNETQNEAAFRAGDLGLTMTDQYATFEVASEDLGAVAPSPDTFEFGRIIFAPELPEEALVVFLDTFDNGNRIDPQTPEAVYFTGHDGFDGISALNGGTFVLRGLSMFVYEAGVWHDLQDVVPPLGRVTYRDGFLANRIAELFGDVDGDCNVDFDDLLTVLANWGSSNPFYDLDGDGEVGFSDLLQVLANWGTIC